MFWAHSIISSPVEMKLGSAVYRGQTSIGNIEGTHCVHLNYENYTIIRYTICKNLIIKAPLPFWKKNAE